MINIGHYATGDYFYLVEDIKARKRKYQIINIKTGGWFQSLGCVPTAEKAEEWWNRYAERYAD